MARRGAAKIRLARKLTSMAIVHNWLLPIAMTVHLPQFTSSGERGKEAWVLAPAYKMVRFKLVTNQPAPCLYIPL